MQKRLRRPRTPPDKALVTHAKSISAVRRMLKRRHWYSVAFGKRNRRYGFVPVKGIVDLVALRLVPTKVIGHYDVLEIVLFDLKSGGAKAPDEEARKRLQRAPGYIRIGYDYVDYDHGHHHFRWEPEDSGFRKVVLKP